jgi:hypothetical protein
MAINLLLQALLLEVVAEVEVVVVVEEQILSSVDSPYQSLGASRVSVAVRKKSLKRNHNLK